MWLQTSLLARRSLLKPDVHFYAWIYFYLDPPLQNSLAGGGKNTLIRPSSRYNGGKLFHVYVMRCTSFWDIAVYWMHTWHLFLWSSSLDQTSSKKKARMSANRYDSSKEAIFYNRLFILGGKGLTEDEWRRNFSRFGKITRVNITSDKHTGQEKGTKRCCCPT